MEIHVDRAIHANPDARRSPNPLLRVKKLADQDVQNLTSRLKPRFKFDIVYFKKRLEIYSTTLVVPLQRLAQGHFPDYLG